MSIGENIKRLRDKHGLTQAELGEIAGVSDKAVSTWEKDNAVPRMGAIEKMAAYFGVSKADIIEDIDIPDTYFNEEAKAIAMELYKRPDLMTLFRTTTKVSADDLKVIQAVVDGFNKKNED